MDTGELLSFFNKANKGLEYIIMHYYLIGSQGALPKAHTMLSLPLLLSTLSFSPTTLLCITSDITSHSSQNTADRFLRRGLCPSSACCFEHLPQRASWPAPSFKAGVCSHLTFSTQLTATQHSWFFLPCSTFSFLLQHLSPSNTPLSLLIYYAVDFLSTPSPPIPPSQLRLWRKVTDL